MITIFCEETEKDESTCSIEGVDYWSAQQFADLTQRKIGSIRVLFSKGNRLAKLKGKNINGRLYILATELFDFPFATNGHPAKEGDYYEKFYVLDNVLLREDAMFKKPE